jgi:hypothetical protein
MSHRSTASITILNDQFALVSRVADARAIAILVLVLVLLITNGGAG